MEAEQLRLRFKELIDDLHERLARLLLVREEAIELLRTSLPLASR
jgi:hypothetical protein